MGWYVPVGDVSTYQYNGITIHVRSPSLFSFQILREYIPNISGEILQKVGFSFGIWEQKPWHINILHSKTYQAHRINVLIRYVLPIHIDTYQVSSHPYSRLAECKPTSADVECCVSTLKLVCGQRRLKLSVRKAFRLAFLWRPLNTKPIVVFDDDSKWFSLGDTTCNHMTTNERHLCCALVCPQGEMFLNPKKSQQILNHPPSVSDQKGNFHKDVSGRIGTRAGAIGHQWRSPCHAMAT